MKNLILLLATLISTLASAQTARCMNSSDWLTNLTDARGRNAWARKCAYIDLVEEQFYNSRGMYATFANSSWVYLRAPVREIDPCPSPISSMVILGSCYAGCYTPGQRLAFGGEFIGVQKAFEQGVANVTALSPSSTESVLSYGEQPIMTYVAGNTEEMIYVLKTADGHRLEVTDTHPMVRGTGEMVKAKELQVGDTLLAASGKQTKLEQVDTFLFKGKVWNVQPVSDEKLENIFNAEGLLSGSIRFQNQWADDMYRLSLRDRLEVSAEQ